MYLGRDFSPQENGESEVVGIDFVNDLDGDEQILKSQWQIKTHRGYDPTPGVHLEGTSASVIPLGSSMKTGTIQRIGGLWPNVTYKLIAIVLTDQGNTRNLWTYIRGVET